MLIVHRSHRKRHEVDVLSVGGVSMEHLRKCNIRLWSYNMSRYHFETILLQYEGSGTFSL